MNPRLDVTKYLQSGVGRAMLQLSSEAEASLERPLFELVKIRASQMNGCAYCIDMHTKNARLAGETEQRIYALNARPSRIQHRPGRRALPTVRVGPVAWIRCRGRADCGRRGSAVRKRRGDGLAGMRDRQRKSREVLREVRMVAGRDNDQPPRHAERAVSAGSLAV
jgi:AhpD family alkylhydroperoxidase